MFHTRTFSCVCCVQLRSAVATACGIRGVSDLQRPALTTDFHYSNNQHAALSFPPEWPISLVLGLLNTINDALKRDLARGEDQQVDKHVDVLPICHMSTVCLVPRGSYSLIVDGQQRLVTLTIVMKVALHRLKGALDEQDTNTLKRLRCASSVVSFEKDSTEKDDLEAMHREVEGGEVVASPLDEGDANQYADTESTVVRNQRAVRSWFEDQEWGRKPDKLIKFCEFLLDKITFIKFELPSPPTTLARDAQRKAVASAILTSASLVFYSVNAVPGMPFDET